jgi:ribosomal protein S18 acetylase RimI-like enzyme
VALCFSPGAVDPVLCRPYAAADFEALYALEAACFEPAFRFSRRYMRSLLAAPNTVVRLVGQGGELSGFGIATWTRHRSLIAAYIETLEVSPAARRGGLGRELLAAMEEAVRQAGAVVAGLHVDALNAAAIGLYERAGYVCQGRKENFYPQNRAALIYTKDLHDPLPDPKEAKNVVDPA